MAIFSAAPRLPVRGGRADAVRHPPPCSFGRPPNSGETASRFRSAYPSCRKTDTPPAERLGQLGSEFIVNHVTWHVHVCRP